ncbi:DUF1353 domain-containing protein [Bradyrhizobium huanghuaihaiense]|uniref:DUF1353 domain-containing protein n=1 Tax=Bradyrhizobium huanghuaihaiense TaxID=990078 RepID=UPI0021AAD1D9|nr:DUF1353 domain-containing protein [Bradyrhizobium sp. CB3035]UWU80712.1 DUF1353 domain-containing protein [Bradyrhizobium sp. CB3035]
MDQVFLRETRRGKLGSPPVFSRFRDPIYFLLRPISWTPNEAEGSRLFSVVAPTGFVTDLASIPPAFFSLLRPDGTYAYAAILHDHMYWRQEHSREIADDTLLAAMKDTGVDPATAWTIHLAVRAAGGRAWDENKRLKAQGEKRVLSKYPTEVITTWAEWRMKPDVFAPE